MKKIPLAHNESYWLLDDTLRHIALSALQPEALSLYPDYDNLERALAGYADVGRENLVATPGSDHAIQAVVEIVEHESNSVLLPVPTFYGYERILQRYQVQIKPTFYTLENGEFMFPLAQSLSELTSSTALFLCNPNNPLGTSIPPDTLAALLDESKRIGAMVVLDEAYFEFGESSAIDRIHSQPLIILRTLSKAFGLSGVRVGYAIASEQYVRKMRDVLLPWPISGLSAHAAIALLNKADDVAVRRKKVLDQRRAFMQSLSEIPSVELYKSSTNFVLIKIPDAARCAEALRRESIEVALTDFMSSYGAAKALLRDTLRLAIPSPEDTPRVLSALTNYGHSNRVVL
jgi:histidinol-phosphate aminotransferase